MPFQPNSKVTLAHGDIVYRSFNSELDDSIVALHGWLDNFASFIPLGIHLKRRFYALDLPGHGKSDHKPIGTYYYLSDGVFDIYEAINNLGLQTQGVHLIGHSLGASLALMLAAAAPQLVKSLVLIEGFGPLSAPADLTIDRLQGHLRQRRRLPQKSFPIYNNIEEAIAARLSATDMNEESARLIVEHGVRELSGGWTWTSDARLRLRSPHPYSEEQVLALIAGVKCPVLAIRAEPGLEFNAVELAARLAAFPNIRLQRLNGGHHVHMEHPQVIAEWIEEFYAAQ